MLDMTHVERLLEQAWRQERTILYEHEVYDLLQKLQVTVPHHYLYRKEDTLSASLAGVIDTPTVVMKIVHPCIVHKTEVKGVRLVPNRQEHIHQAVTNMLQEPLELFARQLESGRLPMPARYRNLSPVEREEAIFNDTVGILFVQYVQFSSTLGNELLIGLRHSREFGGIINFGLGGIHTELMAKSMTPGSANTITSGILFDLPQVLEQFSENLGYRFISGKVRGGKATVEAKTVGQLIDVFIQLSRHFSTAGNSRFMIHEFEINPLAAHQGRLLPLDGMLTFARRTAAGQDKPLFKLRNLLAPKSCAIVGVSSKSMNPGRIILRNLLDIFPADRLYIVRPDGQSVDNVPAYASISTLPEKVDLLVLAISAQQAPDAVAEIIRSDKAQGVVLIPGGMGETEQGQTIENTLKRLIGDSRKTPGRGPVFVGGNCLGILSQPGRYDTLFIPQNKLPKPAGRGARTALISQSGAFMITRMSNLPELNSRYDISTGNQIDLTVSDFLAYMNNDAQVKVCGVYVEGFKDLEGVRFAREVRRAREKGKQLIFYKAGRSAEGKKATSGHTASMAGDYRVCRSLVAHSGALVCETIDEFQDLLLLADAFCDKPFTGKRVFCMSNAGFETVSMADNLGAGDSLRLSGIDADLRAAIAAVLAQHRLDKLVNVRNPLDVTPMATDKAYEALIRLLAEQEDIDALVVGAVPLTPAMATLPGQLAKTGGLPAGIADLADGATPIVCVLDSGALYEEYARAFQHQGFPVFRSAERALKALARYAAYRTPSTG